MDTLEQIALTRLTYTVLTAGFGVSVVLGWIMQRSHFCTMGAVSDIVNMGDWTRMRTWVLAMATGVLGLYGLGSLGYVDPLASIYSNGRVLWLSAIVGGLLFGAGMVLASGCSSKTLLRIGGGSLKSLVVFVVMGLFSFMTLRGVLAVLRTSTVDQITFDLPTALLPYLVVNAVGDPSPLLPAGLAMLPVFAALVWCFSSAEFRRSSQAVYGVLIGLAVVAMWLVSGYIGFVAEHPSTLEPTYVATNTGRMEALSFTAPMAYTLNWLIYFSDARNVLTLGVVSVFGLIGGSLLASVADRTFRWEGFSSTSDTALHLLGAALMGVGGVTALGCTVGQGLSGISTLSITSFIALGAIFAGSLIGFKIQLWVLMRD
jgi:uncharacterized membrane protein YedE/YeeE